MADKFQDIYYFLYYTDHYIHKGDNLQYNIFAYLKTSLRHIIVDKQLDQEERRLLKELSKDLNTLNASINSGYVAYDEVNEHLHKFRYKWDDESLFPSYKPTHLSDDEVMVLYDKAMDLYSIFDVGYLPVDVDQQFQVKDQTYYKVNQVFSSYDELVEALNGTYKNKVVDSLLKRNIYINVNGDLYGRVGDRGTNIYMGEETYEVIRESDHKIVIRVTVEKLNDDNQVIDYVTYDYILRFYSNGKWLFEEFYMFK
ncbi:IseA DL-endopeptidase inhibitor family protein [Acidaminobacter sp. JC074]|uniref:IseA DL-endopeptidase inhibitor family protein n=1 Tax=Acidaminobacter sp. JC074 TaxID=2530199 RepID=UPI001F0DBD78|nr:IseA DL-endopeptidase inhibitor family protein [Acidaminobacter sp. JC074]